MKWVMLFVALSLILELTRGLRNPYEILSIPRSATLQDIRKAYKKLAKEWHPDKNNDPAAENKFVEINQAYELLTDPERRKQYDNSGITEESLPLRPKRDFSQYRRFDPLDDLFGPQANGFKFHYQDRDIALFHRLSITTKAYENKIVPKSYQVPHIIVFYSDWCFACLQVEPVLRRIIEELEPIGFGIATIHSENEQLLSRKIGIHTVPTLMMLVDGRPSLYKESFYSMHKIVEFLRGKFPYKLVQPINDENVVSFLSGWVDNRIRALIFEHQEAVRLRYLLMAFYYRERVAFGFVQLNSSKTEEIQKTYKVPRDIESLLLFNENINRPVASLSMSDMPVKTMQDIINSNKYLVLPRLSSQGMFDALCPPEWARPRKRLCVVLVSQNTPFHDEPRQALRQFAQESPYNVDRVRFMYIFEERQSEFISALTGEGSPAEPILHVVILWRRDANHIKYEWLPHTWNNPKNQQWNETREQLESTIQRLLHSSEALSYEAVVKELIDEHAQGIMSRILTKLLIAADFMRDNITKDQLLPVLSVVATLLFIVLVGYIMTYLMRLEEENMKKNATYTNGTTKATSPNGETPCMNSNIKTISPQLKLHELRAETYNGMVRLIKPGCRTLVLLVDNQSRQSLVPEFHKIVWPYRKNKTLMFGLLNLDRCLEWYKTLLTLSLPEPRDLNINPRNCIGTVLSLNGHRKYFCMYHAKHPECTTRKGSKRMVKMTKSFSITSQVTKAAFIGFDSSESDDSDTSDVEAGRRIPESHSCDRFSNIVFQSNLLDELPNWLDRLFEGTTQRYHINYWPDFPNK